MAHESWAWMKEEISFDPLYSQFYILVRWKKIFADP